MIKTNTSDAKHVAGIYLKVILYIVLTLTAVGSILYYVVTLLGKGYPLLITLNELSILLIWGAIMIIIVSPMIISIILAIYYFTKRKFLGLTLALALFLVILTTIIIISILN